MAASFHPQFQDFVSQAEAKKASDLFVVAGNKPAVRVDGKLQFLSDDVLDGTQTKEIAESLASEQTLQRIALEGTVQVRFPLRDGRVGAIGISKTKGDYSLVTAFLQTDIPSLEKCDAPDVIKDQLLKAPNGMVVVCGPSGSGKTTTLLSMIDWLNENESIHISSIENPIAIPLLPKKSIVQQRELYTDVPTMEAGVHAAMHQDLDVLLLGEIDCFETLAAALRAAETGHLVIVQAHGLGPEDTIERLLKSVPDSMQSDVRARFADVLRGIVFQLLAPRATGKGRIAVHEVLTGGSELAESVSRGGSYRGGSGSVSMDARLSALVKDGVVTKEIAEKLLAAKRP